ERRDNVLHKQCLFHALVIQIKPAASDNLSGYKRTPIFLLTSVELCPVIRRFRNRLRSRDCTSLQFSSSFETKFNLTHTSFCNFGWQCSDA
ncbi:hypothetical protein TNCT_406531, partial [Trichonephila clavata]